METEGVWKKSATQFTSCETPENQASPPFGAVTRAAAGSIVKTASLTSTTAEFSVSVTFTSASTVASFGAGQS